MYNPTLGTNLTQAVVTDNTVNGHVTNGQNVDGRAFTLHTNGQFKLCGNNEEVQGQGVGAVKNGYVTIQFGGNYQLINGTTSAIPRGSKVIGAPPVRVSNVDQYGLVKAATLTLSNNPTATEVQNITRAKGTVLASTNTSSTSGLGARDVDVVNA